MTIVLTKQAQSGKTIEIDDLGGGRYQVILDGVAGGETSMPYKTMIQGMPKAQWVMDWGGKMVSLTDGEVETLRSIRRESAQHTPITRHQLLSAYKGLCDEQQAAFEQAHDRGDEMAYHIKASFEDRIAAAFTALTEYDHTNPAEVSTTISDPSESLQQTD